MENMDSNLLLSTAVLPPINYFAVLLKASQANIEIFETWTKQSYRNRFVIMSSHGPLSLTIPVKKVDGNHTLTKDIVIDYTENWTVKHWRAIETTYNKSAFFLHYETPIKALFFSGETNLVKFNTALLELLLRQLKMSVEIGKSELFHKSWNGIDLRQAIHPKQPVQPEAAQWSSYYQLFVEEKQLKFFPNLSILDLLFNEGPESSDYLRNLADLWEF